MIEGLEQYKGGTGRILPRPKPGQDAELKGVWTRGSYFRAALTMVSRSSSMARAVASGPVNLKKRLP